MDNVAEYPTATFESVWAAFRETDRRMEESHNRFMQELAASSAKFDREMAESNAKFEGSRAEFGKLMKEQKEADAKYKQERAKADAKYKQERAEADAKHKQERAEADAVFDRKMKNLNEMIGGVSNSNGMYAEEFFFNAIDTGDKRLFGERFDQCYSLLKRYNKENQEKSEHDILLINGKAVAIVEVKYRARKEDVQKIVNRLPTFRALYPEYKEHRVYLGLAAMSFDRGVQKESAKEGVAIVKQIGDVVVINDAHVKAY